MNKLAELIKLWKENYSNDTSRYNEDQILNIAANCLSLSKTWFDNNKAEENESYELNLYNNDGILSEILHGINADNLPITMMSLITNGEKAYSSMVLTSFKFTNGSKKIIRELGKMDIS